MRSEKIYIVAYDISDRKRWRQIYKTMQGFGEWLQLSVFQCRLTLRRRTELEIELRKVIKSGEDHVLIIDIGHADRSHVTVTSLGSKISMIRREAVII